MPDSLEVEVVAGDDVSELGIALELDADATGTAVVTLTDGDVVEEHHFQVEVLHADEHDVEFVLTDEVTGETETFRTDDVNSSIAFAIPLVWAGVAIGTLLKALAIGTAIVIGTVLFVQVTSQAIADVRAWNASRSNQNKRYHFQATLQNNKLFMGNPLTRHAAITRARAGQDVWSTSSSNARDVAHGVKNKKPIGPEVSGSGRAGYYWHFHPNNRTVANGKSPHLFYGGPRA